MTFGVIISPLMTALEDISTRRTGWTTSRSYWKWLVALISKKSHTPLISSSEKRRGGGKLERCCSWRSWEWDDLLLGRHLRRRSTTNSFLKWCRMQRPDNLWTWCRAGWQWWSMPPSLSYCCDLLCTLSPMRIRRQKILDEAWTHALGIRWHVWTSRTSHSWWTMCHCMRKV